MHVRSLATLLAAAVLAAGCGQAAGGGGAGSGPPPPTEPGTVTISGTLVATTSAHTGVGEPQKGIKIGFFTRPYSTAGPIAVDPPEPVATVMTDADGRFAVQLPGAHRRYFVSAMNARGYAPGRWAKPGVPVKLTACTDCAIPL